MASSVEPTSPPSPPVRGALVRRQTSKGAEYVSELMPKIQAATAKNSAGETNELPTTVPAPQKQFFGVLGQRHVICINGLPNNGKKFVAKELGWYLEFFYGARVEYFQVEDYANHGGRDD